MLRFIKKMFFTEMTLFNCSALNCISVSNQECKIRPVIANINSNESLFHPSSILVNKCRGSCNDINNSYTKLCVLDVVKNMNIKVFTTMSRINKTYIIYLGMRLLNTNVD